MEPVVAAVVVAEARENSTENPIKKAVPTNERATARAGA
jgi:hypothetical protein